VQTSPDGNGRYRAGEDDGRIAREGDERVPHPLGICAGGGGRFSNDVFVIRCSPLAEKLTDVDTAIVTSAVRVKRDACQAQCVSSARARHLPTVVPSL
jgi:hypothetical protein